MSPGKFEVSIKDHKIDASWDPIVYDESDVLDVAPLKGYKVIP